ncbi:hypothetical protein [Salinisphaera orenii]|uniref:hypothetical protein n=1 Tax=Salinisphaera orenii TaxID=856731 RepID=UPI0011CE500B|nr:hypothetical protein [Salinisphaera halophila]
MWQADEGRAAGRGFVRGSADTTPSDRLLRAKARDASAGNRLQRIADARTIVRALSAGASGSDRRRPRIKAALV